MQIVDNFFQNGQKTAFFGLKKRVINKKTECKTAKTEQKPTKK
jgi:hypothetical protein